MVRPGHHVLSWMLLGLKLIRLPHIWIWQHLSGFWYPTSNILQQNFLPVWGYSSALQDAVGDSRLRPRCRHLANSTKHNVVTLSDYLANSTDSAHLLYYVKP